MRYPNDQFPFASCLAICLGSLYLLSGRWAELARGHNLTLGPLGNYPDHVFGPLFCTFVADDELDVFVAGSVVIYAAAVVPAGPTDEAIIDDADAVPDLSVEGLALQRLEANNASMHLHVLHVLHARIVPHAENKIK